MGNKWETKTWGDLVTLEYGKALRNYNTGLYPVFGTNGPIGYTDKPLCTFPSVIVGRKGAYRGIHYSPKPFFVIDTAFYLKPKTDIDTKWAYYQLLTQDINGLDSGSAIPSTSRESFYHLPVSHPPKSTQKAIAHILGTLDDKIELLRSMNETLEAMARALFKSWFIDFDPVRKKAVGQPTGLPPEIDALFPDSFMDSELGEIPKGWGVGTIGAFGTAVNEQVFPDEMDGTEFYVGLEHIPRKSITLTEWAKSEEVQSNKSKFKQEDVLFGKLRPYFHKVVFAPIDGLCSTDILVIRAQIKEAKAFLLMHLSSVEVIEYAIGFSNGTKMPRTNWKDLSNFKIISPPAKLLSEYEKIATETLGQLKCNTSESTVLASIRDSLLPRLISGEIELSDKAIAKIMEQAQ
mgnify:CR=1 FL=1